MLYGLVTVLTIGSIVVYKNPIMVLLNSHKSNLFIYFANLISYLLDCANGVRLIALD